LAWKKADGYKVYGHKFGLTNVTSDKNAQINAAGSINFLSGRKNGEKYLLFHIILLHLYRELTK